MEIQLQYFHDRFLLSTARFPAMIAGVGTGKTYMLLLKIWRFCEQYPKALAMIVRKEYTDLRDSTIKDFTRYFGVVVDTAKEHHFANGSVIMFRHGSEINVLKNVTLDIVGIEQAEEFETEEQFEYLRDRLRGTAGPFQQLCLIANANGHNWLWQRWINDPTVDGTSASVAACRPVGPEYVVQLATSFDNLEHLPGPYIADLRRRAVEAPGHFAQYVMNSFDMMAASDAVITAAMLRASLVLELSEVGLRRRIMGVDVARFGGDEIVYSILESRGIVAWEMIHQTAFVQQGVDETVGRTRAMIRDFALDAVVIDDVGVGGGVTDMVDTPMCETIPFNGGGVSLNERYVNARTAAAFRVQEMLSRGWLKLLPDQKLQEQLLGLRFRYKPDGKRILVSKEESGVPSPDRADALMMAVACCDGLLRGDREDRLPRYARSDEEWAGRRQRGIPAYASTD